MLPIVGWESDQDWIWMISVLAVVIKFNHHRTRISDSATLRQRENLGNERIKTKILTKRAPRLELTISMQHSAAQNISASQWITIALPEWIITPSWASMQSINIWAMIKTVSTSTSTISMNLRPSKISKRALIIEGVVSANTALRVVAIIWPRMELGVWMLEAIFELQVSIIPASLITNNRLPIDSNWNESAIRAMTKSSYSRKTLYLSTNQAQPFPWVKYSTMSSIISSWPVLVRNTIITKIIATVTTSSKWISPRDSTVVASRSREAAPKATKV